MVGRRSLLATLFAFVLALQGYHAQADGPTRWVVGVNDVAGLSVGGLFHGGIIKRVNTTLRFITVDSSDPTFESLASSDSNARYVEIRGTYQFSDPGQGGASRQIQAAGINLMMFFTHLNTPSGR
jgi:hypothetical protein